MKKEKFVIIPVTGRRRSGKDTFATIAKEKYGATAIVALSDWFKKLLAVEFKIPLDDFYSANKDLSLEKPIILKADNVRRLKSKASSAMGPTIDVRVSKISVNKWEGRKIESIRDLMIWFAHEVITLNLGDEFHNIVTDQAIRSVDDPGKMSVVFVTDARQFRQSKYFKDNYEFTYPLKIVRTEGPQDNTPPEKMVDEFPENYFYATVVNDGSLEDLEAKVKKFMGQVRSDVKQKLKSGDVVAPKSKGRTKRLGV
jgi:hypothetical protein